MVLPSTAALSADAVPPSPTKPPDPISSSGLMSEPPVPPVPPEPPPPVVFPSSLLARIGVARYRRQFLTSPAAGLSLSSQKAPWTRAPPQMLDSQPSPEPSLPSPPSPLAPLLAAPIPCLAPDPSLLGSIVALPCHSSTVSGGVESSGQLAPLKTLLYRMRVSQICCCRGSSPCPKDLQTTEYHSLSSLPWLPSWICVWLKPTTSLIQTYSPSGQIFVLSLNLSSLLKSVGSVGLIIFCSSVHLVSLPQFEAFEMLSSFSPVMCLLICVIWRPLPLYEDSLSLYEESLPPCEDLLPLYEDSLPPCEDLLPQYEDLLPQYEDLLPHYEVVNQNLYFVFVQSALLVLLPHDAGLHFRNMGVVFTITNLRSLVSDSVRRLWKDSLFHTFTRLRISSQFPGLSRRCFVVSIAKFLAASFALVAEVCSGNASPSVLSFSQDFISLSTMDVIISSCLNGLYVFIIYVYASRFAFVAAVDYAGLAIVFCFSNFCSVFGE